MHLHIGVLLFLEAPDLSSGKFLELIKRQIQSRLEWMPHFRDSIAEVPFGISEPYWITNENFDISNHVRLSEDQKHYSRKELLTLVGSIISEPLDKSKPLWEVILVPQVADNRVALIAKLHHALIDGVQGIEVLVNLLDFERKPAQFWGTSNPVTNTNTVDLQDLVDLIGKSLVTKVRNAPKDLSRALLAVGDWYTFRRNSDNAKLLKPIFGAPKTPINGTLSTSRVAAALDIDQAQVVRIAKEFSATVNDVVMLLVSLAMDEYLANKGWDRGTDLTAMMPIANSKRNAYAGTNQISSLFISLANSVADPIDRLREITRATKAAKTFYVNSELGEITRLAEYVPPLFTWAISRLAHETRIFDRIPPAFNVLVSTVNGTDIPLYFSGMELLEIIPFGPLADSSALNITTLSYNKKMTVGIVGESNLTPDVDELGAFMDKAMDRVLGKLSPS